MLLSLPPDAPPRTERTTIVVCRGPHCREHGSLSLRRRLVSLLRRDPRARLVGYACLGQCDHGPNVAFLPEGQWYGGLTLPDAAERVVSHAVEGAPMPCAPLNLAPVERARHLSNFQELLGALDRDARRARRRWWWPF